MIQTQLIPFALYVTKEVKALAFSQVARSLIKDIITRS